MVALKEKSQLKWDADADGSEHGCFAYDSVWVCNRSKVQAVDLFTGEQLATYSDFEKDPRKLAPFAGGIAVATDFGRLYKIDLETGATQKITTFSGGYVNWMQEFEGHLYIATDKQLVMLDSDGNEVAVYGRSCRGEPVIGSGYIFYGFSSSGNYGVAVLDVKTLKKQWEISTSGAVDTPLATDGVHLFFSDWNKKAYIYNIAERKKQSGDLTFNSKISAQIASDGKNVCIPCEDKSIYVLTPQMATVKIPTGIKVNKSGKQTIKYKQIEEKQWKIMNRIRLEMPPMGRSYLSDGILYIADTHRSYAIKIDTQQVIDYEYGNGPDIIGLRNDIVYLRGSQKISAVSFKEVFGSYAATSQLVQDFDFSGKKSSEPTKISTYTTELTLTDPDGAPRDNMDVRIWATEPTKISVGNIEYSVDTRNFAQVSTDGNGKVRITSPANSLSSPGLLLWAQFMVEDEQILIHPDNQVHSDLCNIDKNGLKNAKGFNNKKIVKKEYQDDDQAIGAVVDSVKALMQMTQPSSADGQPVQSRSVKNDYVTRGYDSGTIRTVKSGDSASQIKCEQNFSLSLRAGSASFQQLDTEQTQTEVQARSVYARAVWDEIEDGWNDFTDAVDNAGSDFVDLVVYAGDEFLEQAEAVATLIVDGVETVYKFVVDTVEKAVKLVEAIFEAIVEAIQFVIEWLSWLLDWQRINEMRKHIAKSVNEGLSYMMSDEVLGLAKSMTDESFGDLKAQMHKAFDEMRKIVGDSKVIDVESGGETGSDEPDNGARDNWLTQKFTDNAFPQSNNSSARQVESPSTSARSMSGIDAGDATDAINDFYKKVEKLITDEVFQEMLDVASKLNFDSSSAFLNSSLSALIDVAEGFFELALDFIEVIVSGLVDLLGKLGDTLHDFLNDEIDIPFISDLYEWVVGSKLTVLNLIAFIAAVPAVIYEKATDTNLISGTKTAAAQQTSTRSTQQRSESGDIDPNTSETFAIIASIVQALWGPTTGFVAFHTKKPIPQIAGIGFPLVFRSLLMTSICTKTKGDKWTDVALWLYPSLNIINDLVFVCSHNRDLSRDVPSGQAISAILAICHWDMLANLRGGMDTEDALFYFFPGLPLFVKFLRNWEPYGFAASVATGFITHSGLAIWRAARIGNQMKNN